MKKMNKKGFTLAELLIVIAIMAILIAIAIPVFSAQLEKARVAVDQGTARSARSLAEANYLLEQSDKGGTWYYSFAKDADNNLTLKSVGTAAGTKVSDSDVAPTSNTYKDKGMLYVMVVDGAAHDSWTSASYS